MFSVDKKNNPCAVELLTSIFLSLEAGIANGSFQLQINEKYLYWWKIDISNTELLD